MRTIGIIVFWAGLLGLLISCNMDTTVSSGMGGGRVHNIGLMRSQENGLIISGLMIVVGVFLWSKGPKKSAAPVEAPPSVKTCPFCAESILAQAKVCRYCQRDLPE